MSAVAEGRFMEALEDILPELEHVVNAVYQQATHWLLFYRPVLPRGQ